MVLLILGSILVTNINWTPLDCCLSDNPALNPGVVIVTNYELKYLSLLKIAGSLSSENIVVGHSIYIYNSIPNKQSYAVYSSNLITTKLILNYFI
jgi:hypothetical protein